MNRMNGIIMKMAWRFSGLFWIYQQKSTNFEFEMYLTRCQNNPFNNKNQTANPLQPPAPFPSSRCCSLPSLIFLLVGDVFACFFFVLYIRCYFVVCILSLSLPQYLPSCSILWVGLFAWHAFCFNSSVFCVAEIPFLSLSHSLAVVVGIVAVLSILGCSMWL